MVRGGDCADTSRLPISTYLLSKKVISRSLTNQALFHPISVRIADFLLAECFAIPGFSMMIGEAFGVYRNTVSHIGFHFPKAIGDIRKCW